MTGQIAARFIDPTPEAREAIQQSVDQQQEDDVAATPQTAFDADE